MLSPADAEQNGKSVPGKKPRERGVDGGRTVEKITGGRVKESTSQLSAVQWVSHQRKKA